MQIGNVGELFRANKSHKINQILIWTWQLKGWADKNVKIYSVNLDSLHNVEVLHMVFALGQQTTK